MLLHENLMIFYCPLDGEHPNLPPFLSFLKVEFPYIDGMEEVVGSNPICSIAQKPVNMRLLSFFFVAKSTVFVDRAW